MRNIKIKIEEIHDRDGYNDGYTFSIIEIVNHVAGIETERELYSTNARGVDDFNNAFTEVKSLACIAACGISFEPENYSPFYTE